MHLHSAFAGGSQSRDAIGTHVSPQDAFGERSEPNFGKIAYFPDWGDEFQAGDT